MSMKNIRECIDIVAKDPRFSVAARRMADDARCELAAIGRAARALTTGGDMGEVAFANGLMETIAQQTPTTKGPDTGKESA